MNKLQALWRRVRFAAFAFAFLLVPALVYGQESANTIPSMSQTDIDNFGTLATNVKQGLVDILEKLWIPVAAVLMAGIALWAVPRVVGLFKSAFQSGKGR